MKLEDLIPQKPVFTLASTGKEYELRIPNLEDRVEMIRICGGADQIFQVFKEQKWPIICRIIYRLMKDKSEFLAVKEKVVDDDGFEKEVMTLGYTRLLRAIGNQTESILILGALTTAITSGEPMIQEYVENEVKKNNLILTGATSSTESPPSMATPLNSSDNSPIESSA